MSHSYLCENTMFQYNSDFSGQVTILNGGGEIKIPAQDLLEFVAECFVKKNSIGMIEQAGTIQTLLGEGFGK